MGRKVELFLANSLYNVREDCYNHHDNYDVFEAIEVNNIAMILGNMIKPVLFAHMLYCDI